MDKDDYRPKYSVGQLVVVDQALPTERVDRIIGRKVTRNTKRQDTYYYLEGRKDNPAGAQGAWEWNLQPYCELVAPSVALERIVAGFDDRLSFYQLSYVRQRQGLVDKVHVHLEATHKAKSDGSTVSRIDIWTDAPNGKLQTAGPSALWTYQIMDGKPQEANNLGSVIVATYNESLS